MQYEKTSLEKLTHTIKSYFPDADTSLVDKAYRFSEHAHRNQKRSSGDPYIIHPLEVAQTLADLKLDLPSILTALLHDTVEDTEVTLADIEKEFGEEVSELVDGVTKLSKIEFQTREEKQAENFRKMIIAMSKDIRVILVKLSDRLNNMRTLQALPAYKQKRISEETLDIYAPIANRLGMSWIKIELEDLCLKHLHPDVYTKLSDVVSKSRKDREKVIEEFTNELQDKLKEYDINGSVQGRAKHFYSIFKKMESRSVDFEQIHDVIAFRIVVDNITECYKALGVIHASYKPIPGRFKDYIAMAKSNGYQSLHTTVIGPRGDRMEIQIRTSEMHDIAERGIAAHWKYKEGKFDRSGQDVAWVNRLVEWQSDLKDPNEFLETVKIDLFAEDVFVFTPNGEVKQLPHGATPLDFAYSVHTELGNKCVGAKVNGKIVPLKFRLQSGDTISILTSPSQVPNKDWLKIVKTSRAKAKIRSFIKTEERKRAKELGEEILEKHLKKYEVNLHKLEKSDVMKKALQELSIKSPEELYIRVGYGRSSIDDITPLFVSKEKMESMDKKAAEPPSEHFLSKVFKSARQKNLGSRAISVANLNDVLIRFAKCCNPVPGDSIVGFITRGRGVTIHQANCPKALDMDYERRVETKWNVKEENTTFKTAVKLRILCDDEPGILALISQTISGLGVNISSATIRTTKDKRAVAMFEVQVQHISQVQKIQSALESKKGVFAVERMRS